MAQHSTIEICRADLFTSEEALKKKYTDAVAARVIRIREFYNYWLANPDVKQREIVSLIQQRFPDMPTSSAYNDVATLKALLPMLNQNSREFHRWRYNEMIMDTYRKAKRRSDTKTMERCATSYAKYNRIDAEDAIDVPYDKIVVQPFVATMDVSVLGIKPIDNVFHVIESLTKELSGNLSDIEDVEYEDADLDEKFLFAPLESTQDGEEDLL